MALPALGEILKKCSDFLNSKGIKNSRLEAELLISHSLQVDRVWIYLNTYKPLNLNEQQLVRDNLARRAKREPLAYITGKKEFYGRDFFVQQPLLVPRPDTETLVVGALDIIPKNIESKYYIADICSGTGIIGISILLEHDSNKSEQSESVYLYSVDISEEAKKTTRKNSDLYNISPRVATLVGDLLSPIPKNRTIDLIVSNPPYIKTDEIKDLEPELQFEDRLALDGGKDGLDIYRRLIPAALKRARIGALFEVGKDQAETVAQIAKNYCSKIEFLNDLSGIKRVVVCLEPKGDNT